MAPFTATATSTESIFWQIASFSKSKTSPNGEGTVDADDCEIPPKIKTLS